MYSDHTFAGFFFGSTRFATNLDKISKTAQSTTYDAVPTRKPTDANYDIEIGDVVLGDTNVGLSGSQSQKMLHVGFVRKVYGILSCQLLLTGAISSVPIVCFLYNCCRVFA